MIAEKLFYQLILATMRQYLFRNGCELVILEINASFNLAADALDLPKGLGHQIHACTSLWKSSG